MVVVYGLPESTLFIEQQFVVDSVWFQKCYVMHHKKVQPTDIKMWEKVLFAFMLISYETALKKWISVFLIVLDGPSFNIYYAT